MSDDGRRTLRVAGLLRAHLTELLQRELADDELRSVVVTSVEISRDLGVATVRVRGLRAEDGAAARKSLLLRLRKVAPRLRRALGPRLELRKLPELRFVYDTGEDARSRVEELLGEIAKDPKGE